MGTSKRERGRDLSSANSLPICRTTRSGSGWSQEDGTSSRFFTRKEGMDTSTCATFLLLCQGNWQGAVSEMKEPRFEPAIPFYWCCKWQLNPLCLNVDSKMFSFKGIWPCKLKLLCLNLFNITEYCTAPMGKCIRIQRNSHHKNAFRICKGQAQW